MFKCGTIQISNHLHTVEHVVQSKCEKKNKKKTYFFVCWVGGGGGGVATALMAQSRQWGIRTRSDRKKIMCSLIFCTDATYKISSS